MDELICELGSSAGPCERVIDTFRGPISGTGTADSVETRAVPAADGWSQEVFFRGYVLFRLARGGIPGLAQVLISGGLFAAIHIGYAGEGTIWTVLSPLVGTFMLGCFYAWSVQSGRGSLMPVVFCRILIIVITQPWLALAR